MNWDRPDFVKKRKPAGIDDLKDADRGEIIQKSKETPDSEITDLVLTLNEICSREVEQHRSQYPFLTAVGTEKFDTSTLAQIVHACQRRVAKLEKRDRRKYAKKYRELLGAAWFRDELRDSAANVYKYHIPMYTIMFQEVERRRLLQEVYIGRDAIFMYFARRAYLWGCGESAGKTKYLQFPRGFMTPKEKVDLEILRRYLHDKGISGATTTLFVDIGPNATIPKYILSKIFNISDKMEIDKHSLTTPTADDIGRSLYTIEQIEEAPKPTSKAAGLYVHPRTRKLMPVTWPSLPEEILVHELMKYLCMRHFYLQGRAKQNAVE